MYVYRLLSSFFFCCLVFHHGASRQNRHFKSATYVPAGAAIWNFSTSTKARLDSCGLFLQGVTPNIGGVMIFHHGDDIFRRWRSMERLFYSKRPSKNRAINPGKIYISATAVCQVPASESFSLLRYKTFYADGMFLSCRLHGVSWGDCQFGFCYFSTWRKSSMLVLARI